MRANNSHRWVRYSGNPFPKEILEFGCDNPRHALALPEHVHDGAFEFVVIEKGHAEWEIGGYRFQSRAGDVFHTCPGELHRGRYEVIEPCRFWWIQLVVPFPVELPQMSSWLSIPLEEVTPLVTGLWNLPRVQQCGPFIIAPLKRLREAVESGDVIAGIECRTAILDFLVRLLRPGLQRPVPSDVLRGLEAIAHQMNTSPEWRPKIPELARRLGVSVSHFHRIFRDYTGLSPKDYLERVRMQEACHRLATTNDPITKISFDLGYVTSQHFATAFRRITGQSPRQWRSSAFGQTLSANLE